MSQVSGDSGQPRHFGADFSQLLCDWADLDGVTDPIAFEKPLCDMNPLAYQPQFLLCKGCSLVNSVISFFLPGLSSALAQARPQNSGFGGKVEA